MLDEFTQKRLARYAEQFVDIYTETEEGHPMEAGSWARANIPEQYMEAGSPGLVCLQENIREEFQARGWEISTPTIH